MNSENNMDCMKCGAKMSEASLEGAMSVCLYLSKREKGIFGTEKSTGVKCFFCSACGYIELQAADPLALL